MQNKLMIQCPFVTGINMLSCAAMKEVYIPSAYEVQEYCKNTLHTMCSRYLKRDMSQCGYGETQ